jgi:hypothetical protein
MEAKLKAALKADGIEPPPMTTDDRLKLLRPAPGDEEQFRLRLVAQEEIPCATSLKLTLLTGNGPLRHCAVTGRRTEHA